MNSHQLLFNSSSLSLPSHFIRTTCESHFRKLFHGVMDHRNLKEKKHFVRNVVQAGGIDPLASCFLSTSLWLFLLGQGQDFGLGKKVKQHFFNVNLFTNLLQPKGLHFIFSCWQISLWAIVTDGGFDSCEDGTCDVVLLLLLMLLMISEWWFACRGYTSMQPTLLVESMDT